MMQSRLASFVAKLPEREVDAILFSGAEQATAQAPHFNVEQVRVGWDWLLTQLKESGAKRVGFEGQAMTVATYNSLMNAIGEDFGLSGRGDVRIEDIVILREGGATPLSKASK